MTDQAKHKQEIRQFLEKIVVNAGIGRLGQQASFEDKILPQVKRDLAAVCGQGSQVRRARKSIAGFKMREGQIVGLKATLRRQKMVDFFERLARIVLPRVRDFGGLKLTAVDEGGVLNIGFREQFVFPEINPEESPYVFSLEVSLVPRRRDRVKAIETLRRLGLPFKEDRKK